MKKLKAVTSIVCAMLLVLSLAALCGCQSKAEKIAGFVGTWTMTNVVNNAGETPQDVMTHLQESGLNYQLIMKEDGNGTLDLAGAQSVFTWEMQSASEATLLFTENQQEMTVVMEDGKITIDDSDLTMEFTKNTGTDQSSTQDNTEQAAS